MKVRGQQTSQPAQLDPSTYTDKQGNSYASYQGKAQLFPQLSPPNWANIKDEYMLSPIYGGDGRVLILQDPFKSRYDCTKCMGVGHLGEVCKFCLGTRYEKAKEENGYCRDCTVGEVGSGVGRTLGHVPCDQCHGRGGTIITPDDSKNDTTMGNILAVSEHGIRHVKPGDKVMYTNYTGNKFEFLSAILRVCVEKDLLCLVKKLKESVGSVSEQGYAELENVGIAHE